jgi:hypothetical protein
LNNQRYLQQTQADLLKIQQTPNFKQAERNLLGDSLITQVDKKKYGAATSDVDSLISIAFRIEQIAIRLLSNTETSDDTYKSAKEAFEIAAKLFEQLAEAETISNQRIHLDLYLHSAIDFSLGEYHANASVMARKVIGQFFFEDDNHSKVLRATFLLLKRNIIEIVEFLNGLLINKAQFDSGIQERANSTNIPSDEEIIEDVGHFLTL